MNLLFAYLLYFIAISMFCNENIFCYFNLCLLSIFLGAAQTYPPPDYSPPTYESSYCETNDDEYGRPYYSPYDNYHPPYSTYGPYDRPTSKPTISPKPPNRPNNPGRGKRQIFIYPACVRANECRQRPGTNVICMTNAL